MRKLQAVLNAGAKHITGLRRIDHITLAQREELHRLPVEHRITCKIALLVYKCLHGIGPLDFAGYCVTLSAANLGDQLHSAARDVLQQLRTGAYRFGPHSFRSTDPAE